MEEAIRSLVEHGRTIPLDQFVGYDEATFIRDDPAIYLRYQQAMALTVFLMQWHDGVYREGFLDYVRDAYRGHLRGDWPQARGSRRRALRDAGGPAPLLPQGRAAPGSRRAAGRGAARAEGQARPRRRDPDRAAE